MRNEHERLASLLAEGKITENDFRSLSAALGKGKKPALNWSELVFNPFKRIAGVQALGLGLLAVIAMCALAPLALLHYPGVLDLQVAVLPKPGWSISFGVLICQNIVNVLSFGLISFAVAKLLKQRDLRVIDFIGMATLTRLPYLPGTIFFFALGLVNMDFLLNPQNHLAASLLIAVIAIPLLTWLCMMLFYAYKEASGLSGKRLWTSFFATVILSEVVSVALTRNFIQ